jgi:ATP-dependent Clp protease ATP-binding subunit ClpA
MFLVEGIDLIDALLRDDDCNAMKIIDNFDNSKSNGTKIPYSIAKYEKDLTALAKEGKLEPSIGREAKINRMINVLMRKNKCNPCLIGEAGTGNR